MKFVLPQLPYSYDSLEPYIDTLTMQIHHDLHHATYTDNLNKALTEVNLEINSITELISNLNIVPDSHRTIVQNNAGGFYNHNLFWKILTPNFLEPSEEFTKILNNSFGTIENFKSVFSDVSIKRFGSGWAWLVLNKGMLEIISTPNQDNPLSLGQIPILGLDVWEHAYYLKYQNKRADYIKSFWNIVNWSQVEENYKDGKIK